MSSRPQLTEGSNGSPSTSTTALHARVCQPLLDLSCICLPVRGTSLVPPVLPPHPLSVPEYFAPLLRLQSLHASVCVSVYSRFSLYLSVSGSSQNVPFLQSYFMVPGQSSASVFQLISSCKFSFLNLDIYLSLSVSVCLYVSVCFPYSYCLFSFVWSC